MHWFPVELRSTYNSLLPLCPPFVAALETEQLLTCLLAFSVQDLQEEEREKS